jgi:hypothetical protein
MKAVTNDDSQKNTITFTDCLLLGTLQDGTFFSVTLDTVFANLLVCLLGGTGYGKSRSRAWLDDVL